MTGNNTIGFLCLPEGQALRFAPLAKPLDCFRSLAGALPSPYQARIVAGSPPPAAPPAEKSKNLEKEGLAPHRLPDRFDRWIYGNAARLTHKIAFWTVDYPFRPFFHRSYVKKAAALFRKLETDCIVYPLFPQWGPVLRRFNPKARLVLWMARDWLGSGPDALKEGLRAADRVICCSEYLADRLAARHPWAGDRIRVIPLGADLRRLAPQPNRSRHLILYAGRLSPEAGIERLLDAFELLRARFTDAQLILAGPFDAAPISLFVESPRAKVRQWRRAGEGFAMKLKRRIARMEGVFFTDTLQGPALLRMYRNASLFVYPSVWEDPAGEGVLEALACGLPVVAGRCGALPEVLQEGRAGLLVDSEDAEDWAASVDRLFDSRELSGRISGAARARAEQQHDLGRTAEALVEAVAGS